MVEEETLREIEREREREREKEMPHGNLSMDGQRVKIPKSSQSWSKRGLKCNYSFFWIFSTNLDRKIIGVELGLISL